MAPPLPTEAVKILKKQFEMDNYIPGEEVMHQLLEDTGLKAEQIRAWFTRARQKKKNEEREKQLEIAELVTRLKEKGVKIAELEDLPKANHAEIKSPKVSAGMKDDDETRAMRPEGLGADWRLELEQQTRERGKRKREEEEEDLEKKIAKQDAESRSLRDQMAELRVPIEALHRQVVKWTDIGTLLDRCTSS